MALDVQAEVSDPGQPASWTADAPPINTRSVQTYVAVPAAARRWSWAASSATARQNTSEGMPLLSRIPVLGGLFGSQELKNDRTELVLFITPRVVENEADMRRAIEDLRRRMENMDALIPLIRPIIGPVFPNTAVTQSGAVHSPPSSRRRRRPRRTDHATVAGAEPEARANAVKCVVSRFAAFARAPRPRGASPVDAARRFLYIGLSCRAAGTHGGCVFRSSARTTQDDSEIDVFFRHKFQFARLSAILVAVPRHVLSGSGDSWLDRAGGLRHNVATRGAAVAPAAAAPAPHARSQAGPRAQRATARWERLIKDDMDAAYDYMSPGSKRPCHWRNSRPTSRRGAFRDAQGGQSVTCEADACHGASF